MPEFTDNYLGYLLARCSYEVSAPFHAKLKEEGVTVLTWRVLSSVRNTSDTVNELAAKVLVNQSTLSKALDRMERDNLIERERDPEYRSKIKIRITSQGKNLIDRLIEIANDHGDQSLDHMTNADLQQLRLLLSKLIKEPRSI